MRYRRLVNVQLQIDIYQQMSSIGSVSQGDLTFLISGVNVAGSLLLILNDNAQRLILGSKIKSYALDLVFQKLIEVLALPN